MSTEVSKARDSAVCYSQTSVPQNENAMKLLELLPPKPGNQVLDLGCGTGYLANVLADRVGPKGKVIAVDPDSERIKVAKESYSSDNLEFLVASDQDFPEGEYDLVFSNSVIHWIKNKDATFKRLYKNLKPGGRFGFTTLENFPVPEVLTQISQVFGLETVEATLGSWHWVSAREYGSLATSNGFKVTSMEVRKRSLSFPNIDSCIDCLYGVFQGKFDRSNAALDDIKRQYEGQPIAYVLPGLTVVLTKPLVTKN